MFFTIQTWSGTYPIENKRKASYWSLKTRHAYILSIWYKTILLEGYFQPPQKSDKSINGNMDLIYNNIKQRMMCKEQT